MRDDDNKPSKIIKLPTDYKPRAEDFAAYSTGDPLLDIYWDLQFLTEEVMELSRHINKLTMALRRMNK